MSSRELLVGSAPRDREEGGLVCTETTHIIHVVTVMCLYTCLYNFSTLQYTVLPLNSYIAVAKLLYPSLSFLLVATDPKDIRRKKALANPFMTTHEGKLLITEEGDKRQTLEQGELATCHQVRVVMVEKLN